MGRLPTRVHAGEPSPQTRQATGVSWGLFSYVFWVIVRTRCSQDCIYMYMCLHVILHVFLHVQVHGGECGRSRRV